MLKFSAIAKVAAAAAFVSLAAFGLSTVTDAREGILPVTIPAPAVDENPGTPTETAVFAGGCFWGVQGVFQHVKV
jgi:peptide-methionine (S)-S-oxide reductase